MSSIEFDIELSMKFMYHEMWCNVCKGLENMVVVLMGVGKMRENKIKVLIADDNKEFANILKDYLQTKDDFKVVGTANDGMEALNFIKNTFLDLVILDLIMPRLDGIGVLEELNAMDLKVKPKIVILSAVGNDKFTQNALALGASYFMVKPFDIEMFAKRIKELFSEGSTGNNDIRENITEIKGTYKKEYEYKNADIEVEISEILHELGIPVHIKGYIYLKEAIAMVVNDMSMLSSITKVIYPSIAKKNNTTSPRVERAIRHAIEVSSTKNKTDMSKKMFISTYTNNKEKPTNGEFIALVADSLRLKIKTYKEKYNL